MKQPFLVRCVRIFDVGLLATIISATTSSYAQNSLPPSTELPFNRDFINRYSLDHLPRSLSIRQGADVWFGYDLEQAKLYKLWKAPANGSGLVKQDFTVRSVGTTIYEDKSDAQWQFQRRNETTPVRASYRGCSQLAETIELRWDLKCDFGSVRLIERIPLSDKSLEGEKVRSLRVEGLVLGDALLPPSPTQKAWEILKSDGTTTASIQDTHWHRMTLP